MNLREIKPNSLDLIPLANPPREHPGKLTWVTYERIVSNFVAGPNNSLALELFQRLATEPQSLKCPVYLYGSTGVGKTALAITLVGQLLQHNTQWTAAQIPAVEFARQFSGSIAADDMVRFRERYRQVDILFVDAVENLANKFAAQDELLHTIDTLLERDAIVVVTGVVLPSLLRGFKRSLASRLVAGGTVPIQPPDRQSLATAMALCLSQEKPKQFVAQELLQSFLNQLPAGTTLPVTRGAWREYSLHSAKAPANVLSNSVLQSTGSRVTSESDIAAVQRAVAVRNINSNLSISKIAKVVARQAGVTLADMRGETRKSHIVRSRALAMYLARFAAEMSLAKIGEYFSDRDHTTVLHAVKKISQQIEGDLSLNRLALDVCRELKIQLPRAS